MLPLIYATKEITCIKKIPFHSQEHNKFTYQVRTNSQCKRYKLFVRVWTNSMQAICPGLDEQHASYLSGSGRIAQKLFVRIRTNSHGLKLILFLKQQNLIFIYIFKACPSLGSHPLLWMYKQPTHYDLIIHCLTPKICIINIYLNSCQYPPWK